MVTLHMSVNTRFLIWHSCTRSCRFPEITVETFYPIGSVNHGLYLQGKVHIIHTSFIVGVVAHESECLVVFPTFHTSFAIFPMSF